MFHSSIKIMSMNICLCICMYVCCSCVYNVDILRTRRYMYLVQLLSRFWNEVIQEYMQVTRLNFKISALQPYEQVVHKYMQIGHFIYLSYSRIRALNIAILTPTQCYNFRMLLHVIALENESCRDRILAYMAK